MYTKSQKKNIKIKTTKINFFRFIFRIIVKTYSSMVEQIAHNG